jgi:hypothetical protein
VRWARLARDLRDLPSPGQLRSQWNLLLDILEEDGDLGSTELPTKLITAYEQSEEAYNRLADLLEQIGAAALHRLRSELSEGHPTDRSVAMFSTTRSTSKDAPRRVRTDVDEDYPKVTWDQDGHPHLAFKVPATGDERLWIGFSVDEKKAWFYIAAWSGSSDGHPELDARWRAAARKLRAEFRDRWVSIDEADGIYVQVNYPLTDFASDEGASKARTLPRLWQPESTSTSLAL